MTTITPSAPAFSDRNRVIRRPAGWAPLSGCGGRVVARALGVAVLMAAPIAAFGCFLMYRDYAALADARQAQVVARGAYERLASAPAGPVLASDTLIAGRDLFESTCAACHKTDGTGLDGLGKDLTHSWFVASTDDAALRTFIARGRPANDPLNTTRVPMPPKGGADHLTDADLGQIVTYVRGLQDPRRMPSLPPSALAAAAAAPPSEDEKAKALAAAGGDAELAEYIAHGTKVYGATCIACHGKDGKGLPNLGKDLVNSEFCKTQDDEALLAFIKKGRDPGDPANTTKILMPPKGGNPALSDDDLLDVIAYVRVLQKQGGTQ